MAKRLSIYTAVIYLPVLFPVAWACSEFLLNRTEGVMSGRTMDFESDLKDEISYMPRNVELTAVQLCDTCLPGKYTTQHAFAFMSSARPVFMSVAQDLGIPAHQVVQVVSDGLNERGLSVGLLWDDTVQGFPNYNSSAGRSAISAVDLGAYILATFGSVAEARAALDPTRFAVVNPWLPARAQQVLQNDGLTGEGGFPTVHLSLHDASHDSLVIEFTGSDGNFTHVLRENPLGVMTNDPQLPAHYAQYERYMQERFDVPQAQFVSFQNGTDTHQLARFNSTFFAPPGDSSSESRFIRLAMLNLAAGLRGWPMDEGFSPNGTFAGGYPAKGLWAMTEIILGMSVLAPGLDDGGGAGTGPDYTQVSIIRDHVNLMYYFRSPASPQWQAVSLKQMDPAGNRNMSVITIPVNHGFLRPWYSDASDWLMAPYADA